MTPRIDAHQHYWRISERAGHWPPRELSPIYRDFGPGDLAPELEAGRIDGTVLVQSLPTAEDTRYLLDLADETGTVLAVVGWVDLKAADAAARIAAFAAHPKARALRPMLQDLADDTWIDDPALDGAIAAMTEHDLRFDALVMPRHLDSLYAFARRYPDLPIVIDHAAKPHIATDEREPWHSAMTRLAHLPNVHCKLSGLWTEAGFAADVEAVRARLHPYVRILADLFGPQRLMWGSDWPVLRLAAIRGDYGEWLSACEDDCERLFAAAALPDVFGGNACRFYRIGV
ncbi:amidohydrolase [Paraburkholderia ginsengiterrae]|uniref:Amidohydrolase n=1 Tax=Paraburkholderia ginsengiterrae TaxID=1462993 RepID=A0A1A9N9Z5_9BURK|nr:amidohydrolase family protein [Paraburkholderia ginsengiterrae]OAJ62489.1 amidohydrolase [Paraburkholderia ginsengiterrae]OAJ62616.1 amidohydrolase [Paraburkholderia ginsengiterrae]